MKIEFAPVKIEDIQVKVGEEKKDGSKQSASNQDDVPMADPATNSP
jgi:hypothetical protein